MPRKTVNWRRQHTFYIVLLLLIYVVIGVLSLRFNTRFNLAITQNTLSDTSQQIVSQLNAPLEVYAFVRGNNEVKRLVQTRLAEYQQYSDFINLSFKNPDTELDLVKQLNIQTDGELYLQYQNQAEHVRDLSEASISQAILRLLGEKTKQALFIIGQGEAGLSSEQSPYQKLTALLSKNNIVLSEQNLNKQPIIADNIKLLVLINASQAFTENAQQIISQYIEQGGNVLILADNSQGNYRFIGEQVGIQITNHQILNDSAEIYQIKEKQIIAFDKLSRYPPLNALSTAVIFPKVLAIDSKAAADWKLIPFLTTDKSNNTYLLDNQTINEVTTPVSFGIEAYRLIKDKDKDKNKQQQLVFIADSDFLSDQFIGSGSNQQFTVALLQHLLASNHQFNFSNRTIDPIYLTEDESENLTGLLVLFIPLGFLAVGLFIRRCF